ncbi:hypothetical protein AAZX31_14G119200 [Glycine max]|nr:hypothetical protein GLYMA_14G130850v4 [Glycine max]KAH1094292.1 hypothetical protein GYH30_039827 [Glycine max]
MGSGSSCSHSTKGSGISHSHSTKRSGNPHSHSNLKILFIETERELIGIDFKQLLLHPEWTTIQDPIVVPIYFKINLLNFFNGKSIVGMKHITVDSNVYLIGGESLGSGAIPNKSYVSNHPDSYLGSSNRVLHLSFEKNAFSLKRTSRIKRFLYGKCSPMVENIEGKIFVLEGKPYLHDHHLNGPFEVYDPNEEYPQILNNPPPYTRYPQGKIDGHFVLGHKFIVFEKKTCETIDGYFYDTRTHSGWEKLDPYVISFFTQIGLPINGICVPYFPQLEDYKLELILARKGIEEAYALLINASSGGLLYYQSLREVFQNRFPLTETGQRVHLNNGRNFFFMLPNNQICAIWVAFDHHKTLRLFTTIFALRACFNFNAERLLLCPSHPIERRFLEVFDIHNWDCVVKNNGTYSNHVFDAFFFER